MQSINFIKQTVSEKIFKDFFFSKIFPFRGPSMGGSRGGDRGSGPPWNCQIIYFCHVEIFHQTLLGFWTPNPLRKFSESVHAQQPIKISDQDEGHLKHSALLNKHFSKNKIQISPMRLPIISLWKLKVAIATRVLI